MNSHRTVITEAQHFNVVARQMLSGGRSGVYAKQGETQAKAMKRILAASRRVAADRAPSFPTFKPGMSTADYVAQFHSMNSGRSLITAGFFGELNTEPAALYENGAFDFAPVMETVADDEAETFDFCGTYSAHVAHCNMMELKPMSLQRWIARNSPAAEVCEPVEPAEVCEAVPSEPAEVSAPTEQPLEFVSRYSGQRCDGLSRKSAEIEASKRQAREPGFTFLVAPYVAHCVPSGRFCVERWQPAGLEAIRTEHPGNDAPAEKQEHPLADAHPVAAADARPADAVSAAGLAGPAAAVAGGGDSGAALAGPHLHKGVRSTVRAACAYPPPLSRPVALVGRFDPIPDDEARARLTAAGYRLESRGVRPYFKPGGGTVRLQTYRLAHPGDGRCGLRIDGVTFPLCRDSLERHEQAARDAAAGKRAANLAELLSGRRLAA
jgi:hypothetical protein